MAPDTEFAGSCLAMKALEEAFSAVFAGAAVGTTAEQIDGIIATSLAKHEAKFHFSPNTPFLADPTGYPPKLRVNRRTVEPGRLYGMDTVADHGPWWADLARYFHVGPVPDSLRAAHRRVLARQDLLAAAVRADRSMKEIFDACPHDLLFEIHRIGPKPNMDPYCGNCNPDVIEGMARATAKGLCFEVGQLVCVEIWAGMSGGIEDMYVLEPQGLRRLSTLPRDIVEIPESRGSL